MGGVQWCEGLFFIGAETGVNFGVEPGEQELVIVGYVHVQGLGEKKNGVSFLYYYLPVQI